MGELFDRFFEIISNLADKISKSKYVEQMGFGEINPYVLLLIIVFIIYLIISFIHSLWKTHRFKKNKREQIRNIKLAKEIEKQEEILALKRKNSEYSGLLDVLNAGAPKEKPDNGITKDDLAALIKEVQNSNKGPSPEEIKEQVKKELEKENKQKIKEEKEKAKEEKIKEKKEKPKTKINFEPKVKEITIPIPIPKVNIQNPEDTLPDGPIPTSVLEKDGVTSSDSDRVSISEAYQDSIEEKANNEEIIEDLKEEVLDIEEKVFVESTKEIPDTKIEEKEEIPDNGPMEKIEYEKEPLEEEQEKVDEDIEDESIKEIKEDNEKQEEPAEEVKVESSPAEPLSNIEEENKEEEDLDPLELLRLKAKQRAANKKRVQEEIEKRA